MEQKLWLYQTVLLTDNRRVLYYFLLLSPLLFLCSLLTPHSSRSGITFSAAGWGAVVGASGGAEGVRVVT